MKQSFVIGTRTSDLALWQANFVKNQLEKIYPYFSFELKHITTKGDKILDVALSKIGDKGLFTKELEIALLENEIDIAVHSLKDLPTKFPEGLKLSAVTKRHAVEDVLIAKEKNVTIENIPEGVKVGTGSLRRRSQLKHLRPDLIIEELRGNVPTRIKRLGESDWYAIILARAGVERLGFEEYISSYIDIADIVPAVGQGALGIETRENDYELEQILEAIHDMKTYIEVLAERAFLRKLEGGCQVPIGANAQMKINGLYLDGIVADLDGSVTYRKRIRGSKHFPENLGEALAKDLLEAGADEILEEIYNKQND